MMIGIASDPLWKKQYADLVHENKAKKGEHAIPEPEFRLPPAVWGAWLVPVGLFGMVKNLPAFLNHDFNECYPAG